MCCPSLVSRQFNYRLGKNRCVASSKLKLFNSRHLPSNCCSRHNSSFNLLTRHCFFKRHLYGQYCEFVPTFITRDTFDCSIQKGQPDKVGKRAKCASTSEETKSYEVHICSLQKRLNLTKKTESNMNQVFPISIRMVLK